MKIPFHVPYFSGKEQQLVIDAIQRGSISGDGFYTKKVKELLEKMFQVHHVLLTTSGTHALELAVLLTDIQPGDEVIMPSFTFPSTANAVLLRGGKPVFAEIEPVTLNLDPEDLDRKITNRTRAVIPVHYAGIGCRMDEINRVALKHQLTVIEDAAQGVNALYRDRYLGTWGDFG
ncbi:MAG TPA: aminotransferase class I/II-fold pyridoxal phosphate-dependent enzyme, partial [Bacillota bacterium]|nr:aminotransferase class I/II-fold pyridoxal phosphate-dependent enzyme [Bacillota bacterium]